MYLGVFHRQHVLDAGGYRRGRPPVGGRGPGAQLPSPPSRRDGLARSRRSGPGTSRGRRPERCGASTSTTGCARHRPSRKHRTLPYWRPLVPAAMVARHRDGRARRARRVGGRCSRCRPCSRTRRAPGVGCDSALTRAGGGASPCPPGARHLPLVLRARVLARDLVGPAGQALREPSAGAPLMPVSRVRRARRNTARRPSSWRCAPPDRPPSSGRPGGCAADAAPRSGRTPRPVRHAPGLGRPRPVRGRHRAGAATARGRRPLPDLRRRAGDLRPQRTPTRPRRCRAPPATGTCAPRSTPTAFLARRCGRSGRRRGGGPGRLAGARRAGRVRARARDDRRPRPRQPGRQARLRWFLLAANVEDDPLGPRVRRRFLRSGSAHRQARSSGPWTSTSPMWWSCSTGCSCSSRSPGRSVGRAASTW